MSQSDYNYFVRRANEERAAAAGAAHAQAKRSHLELAHRYDVAAAAALGQPVVQLNTGRTSFHGLAPERAMQLRRQQSR